MKKFKIIIAMLAIFSLFVVFACKQPSDSNATKYKITFDSQGGSIVNSVDVEEGKLITKPEDPKKTNFVFQGWYKEDTFTTKWNFATDKVTENITLYAKFVPANNNMVTVEFKTYDGTPITALSIAKDSLIDENTLTTTKDHYHVEGWYTDSNFAIKWNFATDKVQRDMILYANWIGDPRTITFNSRDGSAVDSITVPYDTTATAPQPPTTLNEGFLGWFTDEACTAVNEFNFDTPITENIILYAKWNSPVPKDLNLVYNAGTTSLKIEGENFTADNVKNITLDDGSFNFDVNARTIEGKTVCNIPYEMPTGKKTVTLTYRDTVLTLDVYAYTINGSGELTGCTPAPDGVFKIPEGVKSTQAELFNAGWPINPQNIKSTMTKLVFPKGFKTVGVRSFLGCTKLAEIVFNDEMKEIKLGAFLGTAVKKVVLPPNLDTLRFNAFAHCANLETFVFQSNITTWDVSGAGVSDMFKFSPGEGKPFDVEIKEAVTKLGVGVFSNTKINNIDIYGNALTEVGDKILESTTVKGKIRIHTNSPVEFDRIKGLIQAKATHLTDPDFEHVQ